MVVGKKKTVSVVNQNFFSGFQCLSCFLLLIRLSCPSSSSLPGVELRWRLWEVVHASCNRKRDCTRRWFCG